MILCYIKLQLNFLPFVYSDTDECDMSGNVTCHENAECVNTIGSFVCVCNPGFTGDGANNCTGIQHH